MVLIAATAIKTVMRWRITWGGYLHRVREVLCEETFVLRMRRGASPADGSGITF